MLVDFFEIFDFPEIFTFPLKKLQNNFIQAFYLNFSLFLLKVKFSVIHAKPYW